MNKAERIEKLREAAYNELDSYAKWYNMDPMERHLFEHNIGRTNDEAALEFVANDLRQSCERALLKKLQSGLN